MPNGTIEYVIQLLAKQHNRPAFDCGKDSLNEYLHRQASQDQKRRVAAPYILTTEKDSNTILGYYTLSATNIELDSLPDDMVRKLPRYPKVGATLLGRLAVDKKQAGQGLGGILLSDALKRSVEQSQHIGSVAVVVDALDDEARRFYEHFQFVSLPDQPKKLIILMKVIEKLFSGD